MHTPEDVGDEKPQSVTFIGNLLDIQCSLPALVLPGCTLQRANPKQIEWIRKYIDEYPDSVFGPPSDRYEGNTHVTDSGRGTISISYSRVPEAQWKYYVLAYHDIGSNRPRLQEAANLADLELELLVTLLPNRKGFSRGSNHDFVYHYFHDAVAPLPKCEVTAERLKQISLLVEAVESVEKSHPDIYRAVRMFHALKFLPRSSEFQVLGLFGIVELLVTHQPGVSEIGDSIRHQVRTKIPLLSRHAGQPLDYESFFSQQQEHTVWNRLYDYRSQLAHGGRPDFTGKLAILKSRSNALRFLRYATKSLLRYALSAPQLYVDLKKC